jgi:integrase
VKIPGKENFLTKRAHRKYAYDMGQIRCSSCSKSQWSNKGVCTCGNPHARVDLWYQGKTHYYFKNNEGHPLDYKTAKALLGSIQTELDECRKKGLRFNPEKWKQIEIERRKLGKKLDEWLEHKYKQLAKKRLHPSSIRSIEGHVKEYIRPFFGNYAEEELSKSVVGNFVDSLPQILKRKSRQNIYVTLKSFIHWAGYVIQLPRIDEDDDSEQMVALTFTEQQGALQRIPERHRDIIEFGMETGLRPGELVTLQTIDFNPAKGTLWVRRTLSGGQIIETTKGKKRVEIGLSDKACEIARRHAGGFWLFVHPYTQGRYGINALNKIWKKYSLIEISYYEASRHSFVTQLVDDGVGSLQVKELARHSDVRTTQRYYHGNRLTLKDIVNRRGKVIPLHSDATLMKEQKHQ